MGTEVDQEIDPESRFLSEGKALIKVGFFIPALKQSLSTAKAILLKGLIPAQLSNFCPTKVSLKLHSFSDLLSSRA